MNTPRQDFQKGSTYRNVLLANQQLGDIEHVLL